jgi:hypothetical protein
MPLLRVRFTVGRMMIAVVIVGFLLAAFQYDVGMRSYLFFLLGLTVFAASAAVASRSSGVIRAVAVALAVVGCVIGWSAFAVFGTR